MELVASNAPSRPTSFFILFFFSNVQLDLVGLASPTFGQKKKKDLVGLHLMLGCWACLILTWAVHLSGRARLSRHAVVALRGGKNDAAAHPPVNHRRRRLSLLFLLCRALLHPLSPSLPPSPLWRQAACLTRHHDWHGVLACGDRLSPQVPWPLAC